MIFDSRNPSCKSPFGAVATKTPVTFRIYLPIVYQLHSPYLLLYEADRWDEPCRLPLVYERSDGSTISYKGTFTPMAPALYFYEFEMEGVNGLVKLYRDENGLGQLSPQGGAKWQLTVYDNRMKAPSFLQSGVMYQIFPDRFCNSGKPKEGVPSDRKMHRDWYELPDYLPDSNGQVTNSDYFGGDLEGITQKLPYLKSLGITSIYLNPIFEAHSNHRYNTADYKKIDPLLGTEEDFKNLCTKAKELGIHIIIDGVFSHTGSDSVYFNRNRRYGEGGAYNDFSSPYHDWYEFTQFPNYNSWWGFETLPNVNERNPGYLDFICGKDGVLKKWLRLGLSGWRLDVADELPDEFLDRLHDSVKEEDPNAAIIGEVWEDASNKVSYGVRRRYLLGNQLDSVMNYPFKNAILTYIRYGDSLGLYRTIMDILEHYPKPVLDVLMNSLSTHDVERAITALAGEPVGSNSREWQGRNNQLSPQRYDLGRKLFRLAAVIQYMLPGIPCLYYGDEAGLYGYKDPFNRSCYPWGREDQWLLAQFRELGAIRTTYPWLSKGRFAAVSFTPEVVSFLRDCGNYRFFVAVNRTDKPVSIQIPPAYEKGVLIYGKLEDGDCSNLDNDFYEKNLPPYECAILKL